MVNRKLARKLIFVFQPYDAETYWDGMYTLTGWEFENGLIMLELNFTDNYFAENRTSVLSGDDVLMKVKETDTFRDWWSDDLTEIIKDSAKLFGKNSIPTKTHELLS